MLKRKRRGIFHTRQAPRVGPERCGYMGTFGHAVERLVHVVAEEDSAVAHVRRAEMPGELCYLTGHGWIKRHIRVFHSVAAHPCLRVKFDGIVLISSVAAAGGGHGERAVAFGRAHQRRGEQQVRPSVHGRQKDQRVGDGGDAGAAPAFVHGSRRRGEVNMQGQHSGLGGIF